MKIFRLLLITFLIVGLGNGQALAKTKLKSKNSSTKTKTCKPKVPVPVVPPNPKGDEVGLPTGSSSAETHLPLFPGTPTPPLKP